jgi:2-polyprenyl-6-methoxyphenol hydroxylase-like FAD-dependent oxidoreductase
MSIAALNGFSQALTVQYLGTSRIWQSWSFRLQTKSVNELQNWDQIKLLSVQINRLNRWHRPGLLCIGDAAHAMSPAGGVGINLAIQDAVAAANELAGPLKRKAVNSENLARIQKRREFPTRAIQFVQANVHRAMARMFQDKGPITAPWQLKAAMRLPGLRFALGRALGVHRKNNTA